MAEVPEEFNYAKNSAKVAEGFKSGPYFNSPNLAPAMNFAQEDPMVITKLQSTAKPEMAPVRDAWVNRK